MKNLLAFLILFANTVCYAKPEILICSGDLSIYKNKIEIQIEKGFNIIALDNIPHTADTKKIEIISENKMDFINYKIIRNLKNLNESLLQLRNNPWKITLKDGSYLVGDLVLVNDSLTTLCINKKNKSFRNADILSIRDRNNLKFELNKPVLTLYLNSSERRKCTLTYRYAFNKFNYMTSYQGVLKNDYYRLQGYHFIKNSSGMDFNNCRLERSVFPDYYGKVSILDKFDFRKSGVVLADSLSIPNNQEMQIPYVDLGPFKVRQFVLFNFQPGFTRDLRNVIQIEKDSLVTTETSLLPGRVYNYITDGCQLKYISEFKFEPDGYSDVIAGQIENKIIYFGKPTGLSRIFANKAANKKKVTFSNNNAYDVEIFLESMGNSPLLPHKGLTEVFTKGKGDMREIRYRYLLKSKETATFETKQ